MTEGTPPEHDPTLATHDKPEHTPTQAGVFYPKDAVIAVVGDHVQAERTVKALADAGIPSDDLHLLEGKQVLELERDFQEKKTLAGHVATFISFLTSDAGAYQREYAEEAAKGHHILFVHAPERDRVEQVRDILVANHAHLARHYGSLAIEDLII